MFTENPIDLFRLATFVMADYPPTQKLDAAYLYGHTPANEISILQTGLNLYECGGTQLLALCGGGPYLPPNPLPDAEVAYSGGPAWRNWLEEHGVEKEDLDEIPRPPLSHTGTEAYSFVEHARAHRWKTVGVVACPMHMLRAFVCTVSCALGSIPSFSSMLNLALRFRGTKKRFPPRERYSERGLIPVLRVSGAA